MESVKKAATEGLPVYAECGGLIYLARSLNYGGRSYPMSGVYPIVLSMHAKPVGHGYTSVRVDSPNPFYEEGTAIRGHEFHYTGPTEGLGDITSCMAVESGVGLGEARDGMVIHNTLACYTHVHAGGAKDWAFSVIKRAAEFAKKRGRGRSTGGGMNHTVKSVAL
jgi:cobyrinic acid a,c-diamide synthase